MNKQKPLFEIDPTQPFRNEEYERPSALTALMTKAEASSKRSHDAETQVGAVLVCKQSGADTASGCNGFVRNAPDKKLPNLRPYKHFYMLHAEENLVANCAKHGISMNDCYVVCTMSPCVSCMRLLFQCGVDTVIVKNKYKDFEDLKHLDDLEIEESLTPEGYIKLVYKTKSYE